MKPLPSQLARSCVVAAAAVLLAACAAAPPSPGGQGPARPAGGHGHAAFMGSYDADRDGQVTRAEYDALRKQRFTNADTDRDGWLRESEYVAEFEGRLRQQYAAQGRQPDPHYQDSIRQAHERFRILDRNKDGRLSVQEEQAVADRTFTGADVNGDGTVDGADAGKP